MHAVKFCCPSVLPGALAFAAGLAFAGSAVAGPELRVRAEVTQSSPPEVELTSATGGLVGVDLRSPDFSSVSSSGTATAAYGFLRTDSRISSNPSTLTSRANGSASYTDSFRINVPGMEGESVFLALDYAAILTVEARFDQFGVPISGRRSQANAGYTMSIEPSQGSDFQLGARIADDTPETFNDNDSLDNLGRTATETGVVGTGPSFNGRVTFLLRYVIGEEYELSLSTSSGISGRVPLGGGSSLFRAEGFRLFSEIDGGRFDGSMDGPVQIGGDFYRQLSDDGVTVTTASGFDTLTNPLPGAPTAGLFAAAGVLASRRRR